MLLAVRIRLALEEAVAAAGHRWRGGASLARELDASPYALCTAGSRGG